MLSPFATLFTTALLFTQSWATPLDFDRRPHIVEDIAPLLGRQAQAPFNVAGVQGAGVASRLEIRQLQGNADQWNIFLLGLQRMQGMNQQDPLSYYQIAGIHGRPLIPWQNVQSYSSSPDSGYCTHHSNLFPTWHRPYLALFEQILQQNAIDAANEFPAGATRDKYVAAARSLRLPYWDWAIAPPSGQSNFPPALTTPTQQVITPNGTKTIDNPLFSYKFHPLIPGDMFWFPVYQWNSTLRWPTDDTANAASQNNIAAYWMDQQRSQLQQRLYLLLTQYPNYMNFSNEAWIVQANNPSANYDSVESIHDVVHGTVGGNGFGHMSVIDNSAFDPVFWLHHAMVDRVIALWQAVNPNSWVQPQSQPLNTFTYAAGTVETSTSPLTPFYQNNGVFWTSDSARDMTKFGYTYPELANGASQRAIKRSINNLYQPPSSKKRGKRDATARPSSRYGIPNGWISWFSGTKAETAGPEIEWLANIRAQRHGLQGSYFIHVFLGEPGSDPVAWASSPNLVGTQTMLSTLSAMPDADAVGTGVVPLTVAIEKRFEQGKLKSLNEDEVEAYLVANLTWRVAMMDGDAIPADRVPGIDISVVSTKVVPATDADAFPNRVGGVNAHNRVTSGKPGGHNKNKPY